MPKKRPILYMGDTELKGAARYLGGCLARLKLPFDYVPSGKKAPAGLFKKNYRLVILSDYPRRNLSPEQMERLASAVRKGGSLLMIGGWGSFRGVDGRYGKTPVERALPVRCLEEDDRRQGAESYRIVPAKKNTAFKGFDFRKSPGICGYNRVCLKSYATPLLEVETIRLSKQKGRFTVTQKDPLLVVGQHGKGRAAALTTDLAPHWAGGFVDWGRKRITVKTPEGAASEIGETYLHFIRQVLRLLL